MQQITQTIDRIFFTSHHQAEVVSKLYQFFCPACESAPDCIKRWPRVGSQFSRYIWSRFIRFDAEHHPDETPGKYWFFNGFTTDPRLEPWQVDVTHCDRFSRPPEPGRPPIIFR